MASSGKYMFCPAERRLRTLQRGYRTPDPSPSPSTEGVVGKLELCLVEQEENEEQNMATPRRGRVLEPEVYRLAASRTPSPSPSRSSYPGSLGSKLGAESSDECLTPRQHDKVQGPQKRVAGPTSVQPSCTPAVQQWPAQVPPQTYGYMLRMTPVMFVPPPPEQVWARDGSSTTISDDATPTDSANDGATESVEGDGPPSIGSMGHPYLCADACKYVKKARGCKDGANCNRCHICSWNQSAVRRKRRGVNFAQAGYGK
mmetsp:Transcript_6479/g.11246  ORF Transcript_6479/g.11246 Transcript_6479/m.11246 type:complete len:258 (+) Transcript_6479:95-868(+)